MNTYRLNKVNRQLKFGDWYTIPDKDWNENPDLYINMSPILANDLEFIYVFRTKINFKFLFMYKKINIRIIKAFVKFYDQDVWKILMNDYSQIFTIDFIKKYYKDFKGPLPWNIFYKVRYDLPYPDIVNHLKKTVCNSYFQIV